MSKKKGVAVVALIVMGVAILGLAAAVYAKYLSTITNTGEAVVAKWAFTTDNTGGSVQCQLDHNYNASTLVNGKIAPGTSGKCPIQISNANSEVGINYSIKPSTVENQPTNLKFYKEAAHTNEVNSSSAVTGTLNPGAAAQTIYIYWEWPFETGAVTDGVAAGDTADTTNGASAATMTITFDVTGIQVEPTYN